jgi:chromosome segregation ATPase
MTPSEISQYLGLALAVIALLGHAKGYFSSGEKTLTARVDQAEKKLAEHDRRIQTIEGEMKHLPDREAQHRMELQLAEMNGRFATLEERLRPIAQTSERLHELLMEQAKK